MKVIGRERLDEFCAKHADARGWIELWIADVERARWRRPQDIRDQYASASFLAGNRVIFNVRGNRYRLECVVAYLISAVGVQWIGTHGEYDARNRKR
jgi:mRNA interferase HigB